MENSGIEPFGTGGDTHTHTPKMTTLVSTARNVDLERQYPFRICTCPTRSLARLHRKIREKTRLNALVRAAMGGQENVGDVREAKQVDHAQMAAAAASVTILATSTAKQDEVVEFWTFGDPVQGKAHSIICEQCAPSTFSLFHEH